MSLFREKRYKRGWIKKTREIFFNKALFQKLFLLSLSFTLLSCGHFIKNRSFQEAEVKPWVRISHSESGSASYTHAEDYQSSFGDISLDHHPMVDKWITYFTGPGREIMKTYLERSSRYLPMMKYVIRENNLPENLVYVALIESGFSPIAHSQAGAVGYWQFISGTARHYGLKINSFIDERRDPVLSTRAAAEYFKDLYSLFGDWHLALASYNSGEYRVNRVVLRYYNRNFWYLTEKKGLPSETRNYVPKFIAAVRIASDPEKYGFTDLNHQEPLQYDVVSISKPLSLKKWAKALNLSYEELKALNPSYKGEYVPVHVKDMILRVPVGFKLLAETALEKSSMKKPKHGYHDFYWYRVRRGDSLYKIARRNRITVSRLKRKNGIKRGSVIRVGQRLKVPSRNYVSRKTKHPIQRRDLNSVHVVRQGENLSLISNKYKVSIANLKSANNLKGNTIRPGQKIQLQNPPSNTQQATQSNKHHVVKKGDTLIGIAKQYHVNLMKLLDINSLNLNSVIIAGTRLIIP